MDGVEISRPGAIFKCDWINGPYGKCEQIEFHGVGNEHDNFQKDDQWLGMSMDGDEHEHGRFVVNFFY